MRLSLGLFTMLVAAAAAAPLGCAAESATNELAPAPPIATRAETTLRFEQEGVLALEPRETRELSVRVEPAGLHKIHFALLGDKLDANLNCVDADTDEDGRALLQVDAPNTPTTFRVRAWIADGPATEIPVTVSGEGKGSVRVKPKYAGTREVSEWTASVVARTTCQALAPLLPVEPQDALIEVSPDKEIVISGVPVGPNLAVAVRAGHFAWGCVDVQGLLAGDTLNAEVPVFDKPLDLTSSSLEMTFNLAPDPTQFEEILASTREAVLGAFLPESAEAAGAALLDAMSAKVADPGGAAPFSDARKKGGWDALAASHLAGLPVPLRSAIGAWMTAPLPAQALELRGKLTATETPKYAHFKALKFGALDAEEVGIPAVHLATWTGEAMDKVNLIAPLYWQPSRYVGGLGRLAALEGAPEGATMAGALAQAASCEGLSQALVGLDACDATCLASLCEKALAARWDAAINVSGTSNQIGNLSLTAWGTVKVNDVAAPVSFDGTCFGQISDGTRVAPLSMSPATGTLPPEEPLPPPQ
jgi:hypothetical protein